MDVASSLIGVRNRISTINQTLVEKDSCRLQDLITLNDAVSFEDKSFWMKRIEVIDDEISHMLKEKEVLMHQENHWIQLHILMQKESTVRGGDHQSGDVVEAFLNLHEHKRSYNVLGLGAANQDYVLRVEKFPKPDEKVRSKCYFTSGGGNAANTLTALSRLGIRTSLVSVIGTDSTAELITNTLKEDGVDTKWCVHSSSSPSAITHIIIDDEKNSRTCIHTAMTDEVSETHVNKIWSDYLVANEVSIENYGVPQQFDIIHLDSRHTRAATMLAQLANDVGIPVSIDVERMRPHQETLLPLCDIVFTNHNFPTLYSESMGQSASGVEAMAQLLCAPNGRARVVVTTLGSAGSRLIRRRGDDLSTLRPLPGASRVVMGEMEATAELERMLHMAPLCTITESRDVLTTVPGAEEGIEVALEVTTCAPWPIAAGDIVDTTGAGDAFIGGFIAGFIWGFEVEYCMRLATAVAASKLRGMGTRQTLPTKENLAQMLSAGL